MNSAQVCNYELVVVGNIGNWQNIVIITRNMRAYYTTLGFGKQQQQARI
jgi:hypothetical protein